MPRGLELHTTTTKDPSVRYSEKLERGETRVCLQGVQGGARPAKPIRTDKCDIQVMIKDDICSDQFGHRLSTSTIYAEVFPMNRPRWPPKGIKPQAHSN